MMTNDDVVVATPLDESGVDRPDRSLAEHLVERARSEGQHLVRRGGLLSDLTKQVLETASRSRWRSISGTRSTLWRAATWETRNGRARRR